MKRNVSFEGNQERKRKYEEKGRPPPKKKKKTLISNWVYLTYFYHKNYNGSRADPSLRNMCLDSVVKFRISQNRMKMWKTKVNNAQHTWQAWGNECPNRVWEIWQNNKSYWATKGRKLWRAVVANTLTGYEMDMTQKENYKNI